MPMLDMPLEELRSYQGSTPRPRDFDEYWSRAVEEMNLIQKLFQKIISAIHNL